MSVSNWLVRDEKKKKEYVWKKNELLEGKKQKERERSRKKERKIKKDWERYRRKKTYERVNVRERDLFNSKPIKNKTAKLTLGLKVKSFKSLFNVFLFFYVHFLFQYFLYFDINFNNWW